jgi:uncharacterized protein with GYD domain
MATFIMLSRLSPEGMKTLRENPERIQEVNREVEGFGARVVQQYALLGHHDFITVLEAPDAETVSRVSVELSSRATASYETLPAIEVDEFVARIRGEEGRAQEEAPRPTAGRSRGTARPTEGAASEPPPSRMEPSRMEPSGDRLGREQAREDVEDIKEEIRSEEGERGRTGEEDPPRMERPERTGRTQDATRQGRERGEQPGRERDEDRGLVDRAKDAVMGSEVEESRRREGTERPDRR